ncbi:TIGR04283 family arsenosugar biosynthesis glycosyltransferase [Neolewinella antarctica]|nr:TIGR04283 family arsenosugar biosynthesis glycosyltransferase [Neolewinella antarctica]
MDFTERHPRRKTNASITRWCSVIIPTLNEASTLPVTIGHLAAEMRSGGIEVIVADGGSTDGTVSIARALGCVTVQSPRGRGRQMNHGASQATAPYLWFLHADTTPPADWVRQLRKAATTGATATFPLRFATKRRFSLLHVYGWLSDFDVEAFRFGDQSLFVTAQNFRSVGGYDEGMSLLEDNDLVRRLGKSSGRLSLLDGHVTTSPRRYRQHGVAFTQSMYVFLYLAYRAGASNGWLLRRYQRAFG